MPKSKIIVVTPDDQQLHHEYFVYSWPDKINDRFFPVTVPNSEFYPTRPSLAVAAIYNDYEAACNLLQSLD